MSAEVVWSCIRKGASYTKKQQGVVFSFNSVDNKHRTISALAGRRRAVDVAAGKLIKVEDGKVTKQRFTPKRSKKLLEGFRADVANKVAKKSRAQKLYISRKASPFAAKKTVKA